MKKAEVEAKLLAVEVRKRALMSMLEATLWQEIELLEMQRKTARKRKAAP